MKIILRLIITALAVLLASRIVPGIYVASFGTAILVAIVLAVLNVTLGFIIKVITFPLTIVTFGFFLLVVNALVFWMASFVKGFNVSGFGSAFLGALIVTIITMASKSLLEGKK